MSITFSVENYEELVNADLSEEAKKARDNWYNLPADKRYTDYEDECWEAYDELVKPIECKYELNMCNGRVDQLFTMLNLEYNCCGSYEGAELETFISKLKSLSATIQAIPMVYESQTEEEIGENGCKVITPSIDSDYWICRCEKLIELAESTSKIYWG